MARDELGLRYSVISYADDECSDCGEAIYRSSPVPGICSECFADEFLDDEDFDDY